jgi:Na+/H+ antiporter NhaD/arsenite permease-like protein
LELYAGQDVTLKGWASPPAQGLLRPVKPPQIAVPAWASLPFLLLLGCIACMPFINRHLWEHHYHHISMLMGALVAGGYLAGMGHYGQHRMVETALEYFKFIALIGGLFVVTGGILIDISGEGRPVVNALVLAAGALLANVFGTTGASALLIRPFLRINKDRLRPFHVVMFIFIVSNCGGALTPIGDPPLFLGYLYGVPFDWTLTHCFNPWLVTVVLLLCIFYFLDDNFAPAAAKGQKTKVRISGLINFICLGFVLLGVFLDKLLAEHVSPKFEHYPLGALLMLAAAFAAYRLSSKENLARNDFNFGPIKEVAFLFIGIFATMVPALDFLAANAAKLGVTTPGGFYFASGGLSAMLDNAPTYLNFLSAAHGLKDMVLSKAEMPIFVAEHPAYLLALSLGSVFFGAFTYIGNGPNFMVKAIADTSGADTPGFFGYIIKYSIPILLPIYTLVWWLFLR